MLQLIVLITQGPDGDWLAFGPVTDLPNTKLGMLVLWSGPNGGYLLDSALPGNKHPDKELEPGVAIKVPPADLFALSLEIMLEDLRPYTPGRPPNA
jgi:hypothetical protein